jgi:hypothetical protein
MSSEQHIQLSISLDSAEKISFVTDFGWADKLSMSVDSTSMANAKSSAIEFLQELEPVPYRNDCGNEAFLDSANTLIGVLVAKINEIDSDIKLSDGAHALVESSYPFKVCIIFEKSYVVEFSE